MVVSCSMRSNENNDSSDIRKKALAEWKNMKFGLFIHWGIYSIPAGVWKGEKIEKLGEQIQRHAEIPHDEYRALASEFNPTKFDANFIVKMAKEAGMKYVVLTSKHHDGFCMFDSKYTDFDIVDATPYKKDILRELAEACKKEGLKLGLYYSNPDWNFNYPNVEVNPDDGKISVFGKMTKENEDYQVNQLTELLTNYGDIVELFFDMGEPTFDQSKRFAETVHKLQPKCVINGRIMNNQGDFITMPDNHLPDQPIDSIAWEMPGTFYHTWGYKSWVKGDTLPVQIKKQIRILSTIASRGGNFLLNIGPKADGTVVQYEQDVLRGIADWMEVNSEAIHGTEHTPFVKLKWGECTLKDGKLYFHVFDWPKNGELRVPGLQSVIKRVYPLNDKSLNINFRLVKDDLILGLQNVEEDKNLTIIVVEYDGELKILPPSIKVSIDDVIIVTDNDAIRHGKYGRESYRSILKDYYRTWNIDVNSPGVYEVSMTYKMKYDNKKFVLKLEDGDELNFELEGDGSEAVKVELIDGNELLKRNKKVSGSKYRKINLGTIEITKRGITTLYLKPGVEFEMKATTEEFKKQDPKYRSMNISIKEIVFSKVD